MNEMEYAKPSDQWILNRMIEIKENLRKETMEINSLFKEVSMKTSYAKNSTARADYLYHLDNEITKVESQLK